MSYQNGKGLRVRTGIVYSVTMALVVFWPLNADNEVLIKFKDIKGIEAI